MTEDPGRLLGGQRTAGAWVTRLGIVSIVTTGLTVLLLTKFFREFVDVAKASSANSTPLQPGQVPPEFSKLMKIQAPLSLLGLSSWGLTGVRIWWTLMVCRTGRALGARTQFDPALHAAGWILPVVNLWFPYVGVRDSVPLPYRTAVFKYWWAARIGGSIVGTVLAIAFGLAHLTVVAAVVAMAFAALGVWLQHRVVVVSANAHEAIIELHAQRLRT